MNFRPIWGQDFGREKRFSRIQMAPNHDISLNFEDNTVVCTPIKVNEIFLRKSEVIKILRRNHCQPFFVEILTAARNQEWFETKCQINCCCNKCTQYKSDRFILLFDGGGYANPFFFRQRKRLFCFQSPPSHH
jgi:hypothetical protein